MSIVHCACQHDDAGRVDAATVLVACDLDNGTRSLAGRTVHEAMEEWALCRAGCSADLRSFFWSDRIAHI